MISDKRKINAKFSVRNQLNEAAVSYCELMVAVKPSLTMPLTGKEGVIDDSVSHAPFPNHRHDSWCIDIVSLVYHEFLDFAVESCVE